MVADSGAGYMHWTKFRHARPFPSGVTREEAWALVRLQRTSNARALPFVTKEGAPISVTVTDPLRAALHRIDGHRDLLRAGLPSVPDPGLVESMASYRLRALIDEAYYSALIEGAVATRSDARRMIREEREPRNNSERMILNNFEAGRRMAEDWIRQPLTPALICEIQEQVTRGTLERPEDAGQIRTSDDVRVEETVTGEVVHFPPPAAELGDRVAKLCEFANQEESDDNFLHPIVKATLLHYQLAYDHPFGDGNGRTARWIALWFLLRLPEYWWFGMLSISRMTSHSKEAYYHAFQCAAADEFDATYLVRHQVQSIEKEMARFAAFLNHREHLHRTFRRNLRLQDRLSIRQLALVDHALKNPGHSKYTQIGHSQYHGVSRVQARRDLEELVDLDLLKREEGRPVIYRPTLRMQNSV